MQQPQEMEIKSEHLTDPIREHTAIHLQKNILCRMQRLLHSKSYCCTSPEMSKKHLADQTRTYGQKHVRNNFRNYGIRKHGNYATYLKELKLFQQNGYSIARSEQDWLYAETLRRKTKRKHLQPLLIWLW